MLFARLGSEDSSLRLAIAEALSALGTVYAHRYAADVMAAAGVGDGSKSGAATGSGLTKELREQLHRVLETAAGHDEPR